MGQPEATAVDQAALKEAGTFFGRYVLVAKLATGGMGEIFVARQEGAGGFAKTVVIKRLLPHLAEDANFVAMLLDEARIAARLTHPNICQVYELGEANGNYYIAMEHLEGVPTSSILRRAKRADEPIAINLVATILHQACAGLHEAHELTDDDGSSLGLVHRDVSPSNLVATLPGTIKLLDFGVAKSKDALSRTHTGALKGKYAYMSPEQVLGKDVDRRSDVFALGTVCFEMLTLRRLFWRETEYQMFQAIVEDPIPSVASFRADVPPALAAIVDRALSRDPAKRFATAADMARALEQAMAPLGGLAPQTELASYVRRHFSDDLAAARALVQAGVAQAQLVMSSPSVPLVEDNLGIGVERLAAPTPAAAPARRRRVVALAAIAVLAVAAGAGAMAIARRGGNDEAAPPPVVVYGGEVETSDGKITRAAGHDQAAVAIDAGAPDAAPLIRPSTVDAGSKAVKSHGGGERDPFRARLARSQGAIRDCFTRHAASITGSPEVALALEIDPSGKVTDAGVRPAELAATPLGTCLAGVARGVQFDGQAGTVRVTIPLKVRRR